MAQLKSVETMMQGPSPAFTNLPPAERSDVYVALGVATNIVAVGALLALPGNPVNPDRAQSAEANNLTGNCPKPIATQATSRPEPNPGTLSIAGGTGLVDIKSTALGVSGGYACQSQPEKVGFMIENSGDTPAKNVSLSFRTESLNIINGSVSINGQPAAPGQCEEVRGDQTRSYQNCKIDGDLLPSQQVYVDVGTQSTQEASQGMIEMSAFGTITEPDFGNNIAAQEFPVYKSNSVSSPDNTVSPSIKTNTVLKIPRIFYTGRYSPVTNPRQRMCGESTLAIKIANGKPPAYNVNLKFSPKGNIKFIVGKRGAKTYRKATNVGDVSRQDIGFRGVRACTVGKKAVTALLTVSSENTSTVRYRTTFNPVKKKWGIKRIVPVAKKASSSSR